MADKNRILITGGAGFIGSHLSELLLAKGKKVTVIDDLSTGSKDNMVHLLENDNFTFVEGTILDEITMKKLIENADEIYHLAAAVGVKYVLDNPIKSIHINSRGTEIILELASIDKKKVLIASSSEVYGKNPSSVFPETADSILGATKISRWSYACAKALDEFLSFAYHQEKGMPVIVVRFFNTVGPRQSDRYGMVIPRFISQSLHNLPLTVYGDGQQTRSFTYVGDVVEGVVALMSHPDAIGNVFNIGNPHGITIESLAQKIKEKTNSNSEIVRIPYNQAYGEGFEDMRHRVPDITKIHSLVNFTPKVSLDEILERTIEFVEGKEKNV
ncbi:MAG: GDP-mannose 4,6-dehydratase [Omnitrophica bacterium]|nr:GDP-mannose 4,6-dehydratase [Candidatus Omnitrophota bacterium]